MLHRERVMDRKPDRIAEDAKLAWIERAMNLSNPKRAAAKSASEEPSSPAQPPALARGRPMNPVGSRIRRPIPRASVNRAIRLISGVLKWRLGYGLIAVWRRNMS